MHHRELNDENFLTRQLLLQVNKPAQYLGGEINSAVKPWDEQSVRIALAFPDLYEIGMSHLGLRILYHILNKRSGVVAERVYAPARDMEALMREHGVPLFSLENRKPLASFDLVGFSLQYELSYTNVLNMLNLAGIPLLKEKRRKGETEKRREGLAAVARGDGLTELSAPSSFSHSPVPRFPDSPFPLIFAGGPNVFNPEPMEDFIDFFVVGDGEEAMVQVAETVQKLKARKVEERELYLRELAKLGGIYVPEFYRLDHYSTGEIKGWSPLVPEAPSKVKKAVLPSLETVDYPEEFILPNIGIVHDRVPIEVRRGCSCGCRFCQAGYIYRPVRERSADKVMGLCGSALKKTGYEEFSLLSLSTADYTPLAEVVPTLTRAYAQEGVSLSLPSLRLNKFNLELARDVQAVRKSTLTFAPEAGTQRLRDVINKGVTDQDLFKTVETVFSAGWKSLKLYFMIGLPTETDEDVKGIAELANKVYELGRTVRKRSDHQVSITVSTFVPKGFTPFQWAEQVGPEEIRRRQQLIKANVRYRNINLKFSPTLSSLVEGALSRGDRRLGAVIYDAWRHGSTFDGWDESFDFANWQRAFENNRLSLDLCLRERNPEETMPWDIIEAGINKEFLLEEWERAQRTEPVEDCAKVCYNCGISTTFGIDNLFAKVSAEEQKCRSAEGRPEEGREESENRGNGEELLPLEKGGREGFKISSIVNRQSSIETNATGAEDGEPEAQNPKPETQIVNPQSSIVNKSVQRLRLKFSKTGNMAFISHLDLAKVFERAFRRAEFPVAFSAGFNPHPKIAFAAPLGLGIESVCEYCDLELYEPVEPLTALCRLKNQLPSGIELHLTQDVPVPGPSLMAQVTFAGYRYSLISDRSAEELQAAINGFMSQSQQIITRRHPSKGEKSFDILPLIESLTVELETGRPEEQEAEMGRNGESEKNTYSAPCIPHSAFRNSSAFGLRSETLHSSLFTLHSLLRTGSNGGLRPEELISGLSRYSGLNFEIATICRTTLLDQHKKEFL